MKVRVTFLSEGAYRKFPLPDLLQPPTRRLAGEGVPGGEGLEFSGEDALVNRVRRLPHAPYNLLLAAFLLAAGQRIGRKIL